MSNEQNSESLLAALKAERASVKATREQLETVNRQIAERNNRFDRSREIDPAKYQELLAMEQRIADEELKQNQDWDVLKSNFEKQTGELNTQIQTYQKKYQGLIAQQAIKDAFVATGGIIKADDGEISPLDLVT
jgi:endoglucanase Acf2